MAKVALDFHNEETRRIRKAIKRAIGQFEQDCLDSQNDDEDFDPYVQKTLKRQKKDVIMDKN